SVFVEARLAVRDLLRDISGKGKHQRDRQNNGQSPPDHHHFSGCAVKPARCSIARPALSTPCSSNGLPMICRPSGSPSELSPAGTLIAGRPARLAGTAKTSLRYIAIGSSLFSPRAKAAEGAVGARITSHSAKAFSKSCRISVRTFIAWV